MDFDDITRILEMMREHELSEFELERDNVKLRLRKQAGGHWVPTAPYPQHGHVAMPPAAPPGGATAGAPPAPEPSPPDEEMELAVVKSPIVGTFYRASEPGAKPYADVGDMVKKGQVLCIIEAMKLMNEIESKVAGRVVKVLVENTQPVEYGQPLFLLEP